VHKRIVDRTDRNGGHHGNLYWLFAFFNVLREADGCVVSGPARLVQLVVEVLEVNRDWDVAELGVANISCSLRSTVLLSLDCEVGVSPLYGA
jgi:hypothetical protein